MRKAIILWAALTLCTSSTLAAQTIETLPFAKRLKLAKVGDEEAQMSVAAAFETGKNAKLSKAEAAKWYRKAAEQGNVEAQFRLARLLQEGAPDLKKNTDVAAKFYESAARHGHVEAQNWLGYCYQHGLGVPQSDANAVEWYSKAATAGLAKAQNNLGLMYLNGKGVARDLSKARAEFEKAAAQGDSWGYNNLGGLYELGWGAPLDKAKALELYKKAEEAGNRQAGENYKRLMAAIAQEKSTQVKPAAAEPGPSKPPVSAAKPPDLPPKLPKTDSSAD
jgi:TPR repeat protein